MCLLLDWRSGESVTRHLADTGPCSVPKSGHVNIAKIENLHILIPKMLFFSFCDEK